MPFDEKKIEHLECYLAEQEKKIEDLSQTVLQHWKRISYLEKKIQYLEEICHNIKTYGEKDPLDEKPPHW